MTRDASLPLQGVKVVAIEHSVAGPLASRILGELGAEVVKIERPSGDFSRHWDQNVQGEGAQFWWLNSFKQSAVLDLKSPTGQRTLTTLLDRADVLIHNLAPPSATRLGLDAEQVEERFPHLVNCQISGYGADGPATTRKAYDMLIQAETGVMSLTGTPDQPMRVGVSISDVTAGIYSALLVLAALHERRNTGNARHLDVAMFDVTLEFLGPMLMSYLNAGVTYPRIPDRHHAIAPYGVFECSDGERVLIAIEQDAEWQRFCAEVLLDPGLADDPRYTSNPLRVQHNDELSAAVSRHLACLTADEVTAKLANAQLAYAKINEVAEVLAHEVVDHREMVTDSVSVSDDVPVRRLRGIAERIFHCQSDTGQVRPPVLGANTAEVVGGSTASPVEGEQARGA